MKTNTAIIITGMHRSGTSLITGWLSHCGISIGDNLLKGTKTNPDGHFEDLDFLRLHESILKSNKSNYLTASPGLEIEEHYYIMALKYIHERMDRNIWAFKDPRASLFLEWWKSLHPRFKFIFVIRDCKSVVESLLSRELLNSGVLKKLFFHKSNFKILAEKSWIQHNSNILNFVKQYPQDSFVIYSYDIFQNSENIIQSLNRKWSLNLKYQDIFKFIRRDKFKKSLIESSKISESYKLLRELKTFRSYQ